VSYFAGFRSFLRCPLFSCCDFHFRLAYTVTSPLQTVTSPLHVPILGRIWAFFADFLEDLVGNVPFFRRTFRPFEDFYRLCDRKKFLRKFACELEPWIVIVRKNQNFLSAKPGNIFIFEGLRAVEKARDRWKKLSRFCVPCEVPLKSCRAFFALYDVYFFGFLYVGCIVWYRLQLSFSAFVCLSVPVEKHRDFSAIFEVHSVYQMMRFAVPVYVFVKCVLFDVPLRRRFDRLIRDPVKKESKPHGFLPFAKHDKRIPCFPSGSKKGVKVRLN